MNVIKHINGGAQDRKERRENKMKNYIILSPWPDSKVTSVKAETPVDAAKLASPNGHVDECTYQDSWDYAVYNGIPNRPDWADFSDFRNMRPVAYFSI